MDVFNTIYDELHEAFPNMEMRFDEPMSAHTSFRIGGPARLMAFPKQVPEMQGVVKAAQNYDVVSFVIGNGTNILAPDEGLNAFVIKTAPGLDFFDIVGDKIVAGAGMLLSRLAVEAQKEGLSGLEFAHGIPGSVGGAVTMNAGAYGSEMKDIVLDVEYVSLLGQMELLRADKLDFSYRHSAFSNHIGIITGVRLKLKRDDPEAIKERMKDLMERRKASQPLDMPSAGSVFKRPVNGYAAQLIDEAGLKGLKIGGAQVSEKHAGFIVNTGGATARDVKMLIDKVRAIVLERTGVELETEIRVL